MRLLDKALIEYRGARDGVELQLREKDRSNEELERGRWFYMFGFMNHLEDCITATYRLYRLLDVVKSDQNGGLSIDRASRRSADSAAEKITELRNVIEHIEGSIRDGEVTTLFTFGADDASVEFFGQALGFEGLARALRRFHEIACDWLAQYRGEPALFEEEE